MLTCNKPFPQKSDHFDLTQFFPKRSKQALVKINFTYTKLSAPYLYTCNDGPRLFIKVKRWRPSESQRLLIPIGCLFFILFSSLYTVYSPASQKSVEGAIRGLAMKWPDFINAPLILKLNNHIKYT